MIMSKGYMPKREKSKTMDGHGHTMKFGMPIHVPDFDGMCKKCGKHFSTKQGGTDEEHR